jgi:uncharacterized RDD family membrane protein YckC
MATHSPTSPAESEHDLVGPFTPGRPKAPWGLRALAVLLDSAVVGSVVFLATGNPPSLAALPALGETADGRAATWTAGTLLVLGMLQAYTGMTPGKRVMGVAVVDAGSGRPIGLLGTVLRWFAHVLDAILVIGYLRAAWHPQGRTFADSLLGTVAVRTTTPEPHPWVARLSSVRDARAPWLHWPSRLTGAVALVVCAAAAVASLVPVSSGGTQMAEDETVCTFDGPTPLTAMIGSSHTTMSESRLGISRMTEESWQVVAAWSDETPGTAGDADTVPVPVDAAATLTVRSPDGWVHGSDGTSANLLWWAMPGHDLASAAVDSPDDLTGWTATTTLSDGDGLLAECSGVIPALSDEPFVP